MLANSDCAISSAAVSVRSTGAPPERMTLTTAVPPLLPTTMVVARSQRSSSDEVSVGFINSDASSSRVDCLRRAFSSALRLNIAAVASLQSMPQSHASDVHSMERSQYEFVRTPLVVSQQSMKPSALAVEMNWSD